MKYTLQEKKTSSGSYTFEHELDGFVVTPKKGKSMEGIDIKEVVITDPLLTSGHAKKIFDKKIKDLTKMMFLVINNSDSTDDDASLVLDEVSKLKSIIINKYKKFISETMYKDYMKKLYQKMQDYDADIVITTHRLQANLEQTISPTDTLKELLLERNFTFHLWGKLYKRSLWQGISFPVGHYYEYVAIGLDVISRAQRIYVSSKHIYHYRNNPNSIIGGIDPTLRYVDFLNYAETVVQKTSAIHPELLPYAQRYLWMAAYKAVIYTGRPRKRYRQILKDNSPAILQLGDRSLPSERSYARIAQHDPLFASLILISRHKFKRKNHSAYRH